MVDVVLDKCDFLACLIPRALHQDIKCALQSDISLAEQTAQIHTHIIVDVYPARPGCIPDLIQHLAPLARTDPETSPPAAFRVACGYTSATRHVLKHAHLRTSTSRRAEYAAGRGAGSRVGDGDEQVWKAVDVEVAGANR